MLSYPQHFNALIKIYLYYRVVFSLLLAALFFASFSNQVLGTHAPQLYLWASLTYIFICLVSLIIPISKLDKSRHHITQLQVVDIFALTVMLHASGGIQSGLSYLLLVNVAFSGILIPGRSAIALAALTSLLVIGESVYFSRLAGDNNRLIFSSGILGTMLFVSAYVFHYLSNKIRISTMEAEEQARIADHLQRLANAIIVRMRTGIIVVDNDNCIELINHSALRLLDLPVDQDLQGIDIDVLAPLKDIMSNWKDRKDSGPSKIRELHAGQKAKVSMSSLSLGDTYRTVIYLEDHRVMAQQAQQLKLASLGGLTANIAHEIRNPLGAISHAAQLLRESDNASEKEKRLTQIIHQHSKRVNDIVESTLALSSRKEPKAQIIDLEDWLPKFIQQFKTGISAGVHLEISSGSHKVNVDPVQLSQVLTNLMDNGLRYSKINTGEANIEVELLKSMNDDTSSISIIDFGEGITEDKVAHIFEPFYTTAPEGSGLGLYISKELCEINQASLHYLRTQDGLSCFRIDFSHYQRIF